MDGKQINNGSLTGRSCVDESGMHDTNEGKRSLNDALLVFKSIVKLSMKDVPQ